MILVLMTFGVGGAAQASVQPSPGKVTFMLNAKTPFESYVTSSTSAQQQWMQKTYWRARAYPPFYDRALSWSPPAYPYKDLYAIYPDHEQSLVNQHPDWVLRDAQGHPLYIPYGCSGGTCPQYAADIGSPAWRAHWIDEAKSDLTKGYIGVHVDDVNLDMFVGNGQGNQVRPIDPRTGQPMTDANWTRYMVEFLEQIRQAMPNAWISHNTPWWGNESDPYVKREVAAADAIEIERGFSDPNLNANTYDQLLRHIDWLHAQNKSVILQPYNLDTEAKREFEVASYFLIQRGDDAITCDDRAYPGNWWSGWGTDLGAPQGARYRWQGLWRRDFANGVALVDAPGDPRQAADLGGPYRGLDGGMLRSVTLRPGTGAVLKGDTNRQPTSTTLKVNPARKSVALKGVVKAAHSGRVVLGLQKRHHGHWHRVRHARLGLHAHGKFRRRFRHLHHGSFRAKARYLGTGQTRASAAHPRHLRVH